MKLPLVQYRVNNLCGSYFSNKPVQKTYFEGGQSYERIVKLPTLKEVLTDKVVLLIEKMKSSLDFSLFDNNQVISELIETKNFTGRVNAHSIELSIENLQKKPDTNNFIISLTHPISRHKDVFKLPLKQSGNQVITDGTKKEILEFLNTDSAVSKIEAIIKKQSEKNMEELEEFISDF